MLAVISVRHDISMIIGNAMGGGDGILCTTSCTFRPLTVCGNVSEPIRRTVPPIRASVSIFYSVIACSGLGGSSAHMAFARITRLDHKLDTFMEINQMIVDDSCWIQRLDIGRISAVYNISLETLAVAPRS